MTAVIKRTPVHEIIKSTLPAAGLYAAYGAALIGGHNFGAYVGEGCSAAPKGVKVAVFLKCRNGNFLIGKGRFVAVDLNIRLAAVFWNFGIIKNKGFFFNFLNFLNAAGVFIIRRRFRKRF